MVYERACISYHRCLSASLFTVQEVIFADLSDSAVSALRGELERQAPQHLLSLKGTEAGCQKAAQRLGRTLQVIPGSNKGICLRQTMGYHSVRTCAAKELACIESILLRCIGNGLGAQQCISS